MADNAWLPGAIRLPGLKLFLVGFLVLFLELACIRWFAASVVFLQFFWLHVDRRRHLGGVQSGAIALVALTPLPSSWLLVGVPGGSMRSRGT